MKHPDEAYWLKTRRLTFALLFVWIVVTFGASWFARELNEFSLFGFPLGFYMGAQGVIFIYLLIIWFYNRQMRRLEREFGIDDE
ncbi:DUF4212 domain-containing protein [Dechloromonas sp. TW-R-39-2]|uniref:DUF4212 domain-containing protein n=1 Tax=Dechloromonas sp. TW-R-39-2 TaxID=2654218 RepID=UPI00193C9BAA|nr:DUF4212 domain-containing protein [Dechloromonas sp. TW-R-39-2]QRM19463.1 DUF4212 domain-containing protein [Dechloromonas sp. TW-R-39-2]